MDTNASHFQSGVELLHNPARNKGTAFTENERDTLGLRGLLPPRVHTQEEQVQRVLENLRKKTSDLEKYIFMLALQDRNEALFYHIVLDHLEEVMPLIYTPTVGLACQEYGHIFRRPRGIFISAEDRGRVESVLANWPRRDVKVIVVTDGERILGLGDLGANGMGIPAGKISLYVACGGVHPSSCLPVTIDVGTDNDNLLHDPLYIGLRQRRIRGDAYHELVDEFMAAAQRLFPHVLIQFEDFANRNAFHLLNKYRGSVCTFNDDIQGTAAVALAGIYSASRITGRPLKDQKLVFFGAGEAGTGIAGLVVEALMADGLSQAEARARCYFVDSQGLVVKSRADLADHKIPYAQDLPAIEDPLAVIDVVRPTILVGVSGKARTFSAAMLGKMAAINERPVIFALSNPTSAAECTAEDAYTFTNGRAIFASGSPFGPVSLGSRTFVPGQGNNVYIFPGIGLGVVASRSRLVTEGMFLAAARVLANNVTQPDLDAGRVYPPLVKIREVSMAIALATAEIAFKEGLAGIERPADLRRHIEATMYQPTY